MLGKSAPTHGNLLGLSSQEVLSIDVCPIRDSYACGPHAVAGVGLLYTVSTTMRVDWRASCRHARPRMDGMTLSICFRMHTSTSVCGELVAALWAHIAS